MVCFQPHFSLILVCCQNPNLTTTQLQPNLNLVGVDTIITLHHHPPTHHQNSTSTRKNDPILGDWNFVGNLTKKD